MVALATSLTAVPPAVAQSPTEVAERVHREGGYPSELAIDAEATGDGAAGSHDPPREPRVPRGPRAGGGGSPTLAYLVFGSVIAALVVLFTMLLFRIRPAVAPAEDEPTRAVTPRPETPAGIALVEGDPDELAQQGRFEEALAALLLRALTSVGWQPTGRARGLTAREVLASLGVDHPGREPLTGVVTTQERVAFGGEPASRERYDEARRWFASLIAGAGDEPRA